FVVDDFDEAFRPATMLNIRRAVSSCGGNKGGILFGDKLRELCRDGIREALSYAPVVWLRRPGLGLCLLRSRREAARRVAHLIFVDQLSFVIGRLEQR